MQIMPPRFETIMLEDIPYRTIQGITLVLDIVRPEPLPSAPMPVVLYLFGSGWAEPRRRDMEQNPAEFLAATTGICVITIEYRLSDQATFPAQIADVRAAVRWIREHAADYHLNPERIGAWGFSAGGYLATLLGITPDVDAFDDGETPAPYSCAVQAVFTQ